MSPLARICGTCGTLIQQGTHHRHATPSEQRKNRRPNAVGVYNTARWRKLRRRILLASHGACFNCGAGAPLSVHHLRPFDGPSDDLAWDPDNLVALCQRCHGQQHGGAHQ